MLAIIIITTIIIITLIPTKFLGGEKGKNIKQVIESG